MITIATGQQPADFTDVRATNLAVVLRFVRANAPCSRADIAASTGLNKATVSSLVGELIERRLLRETGLTERRIGRPATMIVLDGSTYAAIGVEVGPDHLGAVALNLAGERLLEWRRATRTESPNPHKSIAAIAALARRAASRLQSEDRQVLGLAVGVPGQVDSDGGVRLSAELGWRDLPLEDALRKALDDPPYPITVNNDAHLAALAEQRHGANAGAANLVCLTGERGVGAGIVSEGRLLRGGRGYAGEIGHLIVEPRGPACECGRHGCLNAVASIASVVRRLRPADEADEPVDDLAPEVEDIVRRARAEEPATMAALRDAGRGLGRAAAMLASVLNPEVIVIGGYHAAFGPWLLPPAEEELRAGVLASDAGGCRLVTSELGADAAASGGAAGILDTVDSGRLPTS